MCNAIFRSAYLLFPALAAWLGTPVVARACAVCGGNPDSELVRGAQNGVLLMLIVTYVVVLGMAAVAVSWIVRARRLARAAGGLPGE